MKKFWLALLFILLLAAILTVGLTFTFLYKHRKEAKEVKHGEIIWTFHLEHEDLKLKGTLEDILNVDILKTIEYEVGGNKASVRSVVREFGDLTLTGWMHLFKQPLRVKKITVGKAQIEVVKVVPIAGFTVFNKEGNPDFVTLWHDDSFHHYSVEGELLTVGAFPFAKGDESKHPDRLELPKEVKEDTEMALPEHREEVPMPHEEVRPKEEKVEVIVESKKEELVVPAVPVPEKKVRRVGALVVDLDLASKSEVGAPFKYKDGDDEITITRTTFNVIYEKWTFTLTKQRAVVPYIKYEGEEVDVGCSGVLELAVFVGRVNLPLLASFREAGRIKSFAHRGKNAWQHVHAPVVDVDTLDDIYCFLKQIVIFDFSKQSGQYKVGAFEVHVTETVGAEPFEKFKSFKHTIFKTNDEGGLVAASAKVHKYKFFKVNFNGLNADDSVTTATAFFWDGDLTKPLMIRLLVNNTYLNYVGHKDYELEPKAALLQARLERFNYLVNRVVTINLAKQMPYDFKGGVLGTGEEHVAVRIEENSPMEHFRKCVHTHAAARNAEFFKIIGFLGEEYLTFENRDVSQVEAYFLKGHLERPLLFSMKGHFHTHHYHLESGKFVKKDLIFDDVLYTLKHLAYHTFTYLTLDFNRFSSYHFSGESAFPRHRHAHVIVRRNEEPSEFVRTTHTLEKRHGEITNFFVLALKGADIVLKDQVVSSVDAYYVKRHLDDPIAINFKGAANRLYVATKNGFEQKDSIILSNLEKVMRRAAHDKLKLVYLQLHRTSSYYDEHLDGLSVKVEDKTDELDIDEFKMYVHAFPESSDVRFLLKEAYFDPKVDTLVDLNKAVVIFDRNEVPVLVSLIDLEGNALHFKHDGDNKWSKVRPLDMRQFLIKGNQESAEKSALFQPQPGDIHLTGLYPY
ncbi:conserved hypothetical protein [Theileria orientalis strain Shintoku]|uniref:Uncharacterized protein n=1 Tax=Theileria orientalis strain Shintoku TaxID=869250 RepID=J4C8Y8_THEOR|nr:conserved hypothetical protein [Theileria orientalis strain Shintoku]BAM41613.1 conserved hypothetical protein [Theileria orientalis strain Shintoku]|eukprot:XP_009691914.1 conserved hypothetical protein [Theileria orientalis strain Shintoku]